MIQVRATAMSEAGDVPDDPTLVPRMLAFHDEMAKAGVLLDGAGLQPSSQGFRVQYEATGQVSVMDGPFAETKELIAGLGAALPSAVSWTAVLHRSASADGGC